MSDRRPLPVADTAPAEPNTTGMTRRDAVRAMALAPFVGVFDLTTADLERGARFVQALAAQPAATYAPNFFTEAEWRTVRILVDYVIPRDERSGSATDAKVPEYMDFVLSNDTASASAQKAMRDGLAWLDAETTRRSRATFADATDAGRRAVLDAIAWPAKAAPEMKPGVDFFNRFRDLTGSGFFSTQMGWQDLQYMGHTFVPAWNGCPAEANAKLGVSQDLMTTRIPVQDGQ